MENKENIERTSDIEEFDMTGKIKLSLSRVGIQKFIKYLLQYYSKNAKKYWNKGQKYCYSLEFIVDKSKLQMTKLHD